MRGDPLPPRKDPDLSREATLPTHSSESERCALAPEGADGLQPPGWGGEGRAIPAGKTSH